MTRNLSFGRALLRPVSGGLAAASVALSVAGFAMAGTIAEDPALPVIEESDAETSGEAGSWPTGAPQMEGAPQEEMVLALAQPGVVSDCLPSDLKSLVGTIERRWGQVEVISTHRPGARIRGSGRPSRHASCNAIDFRPPAGSYREVAAWLNANHDGGVGTYSGRLNHIHIDNGGRYRWNN